MSWAGPVVVGLTGGASEGRGGGPGINTGLARVWVDSRLLSEFRVLPVGGSCAAASPVLHLPGAMVGFSSPPSMCFVRKPRCFGLFSTW